MIKDLALIANISNQIEPLQHNLEQTAESIGLNVKANKMDNMYFNWEGVFFTLNGGPLKLVDNVTYLGNSVSSTERDVNIRLAKVWTAIDRISLIWKSARSDKIKRDFFQAAVVPKLL